MSSIRAYLFPIILMLITCSAVFSQSVKLTADKSKSTITYSMKHPLHEWDGVSKDVQSIAVLEGEAREITQVAVRVKLASFDSRNANRDSHMIEVAEGLTYPEITFASTRITKNGEGLDVTGNLKFHGITRSISFKCTRKNEKKAIVVAGSFRVRLTDFAIEPPSLLGLATEDEFNVAFEMTYPF